MQDITVLNQLSRCLYAIQKYKGIVSQFVHSLIATHLIGQGAVSPLYKFHHKSRPSNSFLSRIFESFSLQRTFQKVNLTTSFIRASSKACNCFSQRSAFLLLGLVTRLEMFLKWLLHSN